MREIKDDPNVLDLNKWTDGVFSNCDKEGCNSIKWEEDVAQDFSFESAEFGGSIVNPDGDIKEGVGYVSSKFRRTVLTMKVTFEVIGL